MYGPAAIMSLPGLTGNFFAIGTPAKTWGINSGDVSLERRSPHCRGLDVIESRVENRRKALVSRWLWTGLSPRRLNPVWPGPVSCPPGGAVARTGLRMMPTFPPLPLKFRRADFLRYGFKAGLSDGAFPCEGEVFASYGLHPSFVPIAC